MFEKTDGLCPINLFKGTASSAHERVVSRLKLSQNSFALLDTESCNRGGAIFFLAYF